MDGSELTHGWCYGPYSFFCTFFSIAITYPMNATAPPRSDDPSEFFRTIIPCEEERRQYTSAPANGFRWFKSENVVDLERERRRRVAEQQD
jgi:hypothetical protein